MKIRKSMTPEKKGGRNKKRMNFHTLVCRVEKMSKRGYQFNERLLYVDKSEIRYYSKVRKLRKTTILGRN